MNNKKLKILVVSRWHYPAANPRSFRTTELVRELAARDYEVTAILPNFSKNIPSNVDVRYVSTSRNGTSKLNKSGKNTSSVKTVLVNFIRKTCLFFLGDTPKALLYGASIIKILPKLLRLNKYDAVISISYPFYCHLAVAVCKKIAGCKYRFIADCGDPLYANPTTINAYYIKWLECIVLRCFDFIAVPMDAAKAGYSEYGLDNKIVVIPQGFKLLRIDENKYQVNAVPTFCYAGVFYEKIRDPQYFFEYLISLDIAFKFVIYLLPDEFSKNVLQKYKKILKDKLEIRDAIPREELVQVMSRMDFVINFDNENSTQKPSKLIDYAMSKRPILSFSSKTFEPVIFEEFLRGNYSRKEQIDLTQYDIRNVVDKFEILFNRNDYKRGELV